MISSIHRFIDQLEDYIPPHGLWNMYTQFNLALEEMDYPEKRRVLLQEYLEKKVGAKYALIGLAPGYAGARFSGEPFNDEVHVFQRTGLRLSRRIQPWQEDTSATVQTALQRLAITDDAIAWNAIPWHPYDEAKPLGNRTPTWDEVRDYGLPWLDTFIRITKPGIVIPVGRIADRALEVLSVSTPMVRAKYVRHPAHGGAQLFFRGLHTVVSGGINGSKENITGETG